LNFRDSILEKQKKFYKIPFPASAVLAHKREQAGKNSFPPTPILFARRPYSVSLEYLVKWVRISS
jgi:hypothetical protein